MEDPTVADSNQEKGVEAEQTTSQPFAIIEPQPPLPEQLLSQFSPALQEVVIKHGWNELMLVQRKASPYLVAGQDLIVQSKTGSGKTGAFLLPLLDIIVKEHLHPQILIMVPTRELAIQVSEESKRLGEPLGIRVLAIYGGVGYQSQLDELKQGIHIVVGTPGRLLDHLISGALKLNSVRDLVLDEADEMLSMGFYPDMKRIQSFLPKDRCSYMFSATMPVNVKRLASEFMRNPKFMSLCPTEVQISTMEHQYYLVEPMEKDRMLIQLIEEENPESAIVFCNTKKDTSYMYEVLRNRGFKVGVLSGDINQKQRQKIIQEFKAAEIRFLVATDVAARGLDVQGVTHVFMVDHPDDAETYVHRAGRTARAGNSGQAISIVTLIEEISLKRTATQFGLRLQKMMLKPASDVTQIVHERCLAFLDQEFRTLKLHDKENASRMLGLVETLSQTEEERRLLGMLLNEFYWKKFTGKDGKGEESPPISEIATERKF